MDGISKTCLNCLHYPVCIKRLADTRGGEAWNFPEELGEWYEYYGQNCDFYWGDMAIIGRQLETPLLKKIVEAVREGKVVVVGMNGNGACALYGICKDANEAQVFFGNEDHRVFLITADNHKG